MKAYFRAITLGRMISLAFCGLIALHMFCPRLSYLLSATSPYDTDWFLNWSNFLSIGIPQKKQSHGVEKKHSMCPASPLADGAIVENTLVVTLRRVHRLADQIQHSTVNVQNTHVPVSNYQCRLIVWASSRSPLELGNTFEHNTLRNDGDLTCFGNILQFFWYVNGKTGEKPQEVQMCIFMFSKQKNLQLKLSSIRYTTKQSSPQKDKRKVLSFVFISNFNMLFSSISDPLKTSLYLHSS